MTFRFIEIFSCHPTELRFLLSFHAAQKFLFHFTRKRVNAEKNEMKRRKKERRNKEARGSKKKIVKKR
jgi:hypothetical protein